MSSAVRLATPLSSKAAFEHSISEFINQKAPWPKISCGRIAREEAIYRESRRQASGWLSS
jgi:hypothetical protein